MQRVEHRLAAIFAAEVSGRGRLVGAGEEEAFARLKAHRRELIDRKIAQHKGRILGSSPRTRANGDAMLAEFPSVVDAIRCAVEGQRAIVACNADAPEDQRIAFRIGVNLGDVVVDGDDIYGDGVSIAACLQALAEPGGICISLMARDQIRDQLPYIFEDIGEHGVKNIARPVRAYAMGAIAIASLLRSRPR